MNNSGKTLTIFLIIIVILLLSLTAISGFFFLKEVDIRKSLEFNLEQMEVKESTLMGTLKETQQKLFLSEEKTKEAENKIESLMEDLELEAGLREEIKKENRELKDSLEKTTQARDGLQKKMEEARNAAETKITSLEQELKAAVERNKELDVQRQSFQDQYLQIKKQAETQGLAFQDPGEGEPAADENVVLAPIVVSSVEDGEGMIISVDSETEFVIVSLGEKNGIQKGSVLSIYRETQYLGDVAVSRVLPEMCAADFIAPLTSQKVRKDDRAVIKR